MKKLVIITLTLTATLVVGRSLFSPSVRAQSIENATKDLTRTENDLHTAVTTAGTKAQALTDHLTSPTAVTDNTA